MSPLDPCISHIYLSALKVAKELQKRVIIEAAEVKGTEAF
jgi:hypothetical protein